MGLGTGLARILLFIFTTCFFLLGLACVAGGIWTLASQDSLFYVMNLINNQANGGANGESEIQNLAQQKGVVQTAAIIALAAGVFVLIISCFGCLGAVKESKCLLAAFAISIALILAAQIAVVVLFIRYRGVIETNSRSAVEFLQNKYLISVNDFTIKKTQPQTSVSLILNYLFVYADCCGAKQPLDAANSSSWQSSNRTWTSDGKNMTIPAACCPMTQEGKSRALRADWVNIQGYLVIRDCPVSKQGAHQKTCYDSIVGLIASYSLWAILGCAGLAGVQMFVILFTVCLICAIDD